MDENRKKVTRSRRDKTCFSFATDFNKLERLSYIEEIKDISQLALLGEKVALSEVTPKDRSG
jgi:hypothetical protein